MCKISLIIPVYGAAGTIAACLDSVMSQTLDAIEAILVDDHGPDDSMAIARQHIAAYAGPKQFVFTETPSNGGPGKARNLGIQRARGEYVAFLDSDDTLDPDFCLVLYNAARATEADLAFGHIAFVRPDGSRYIRHNPSVADGPFVGAAKRRYLRRFTSYFTTYIYRRDLLLENGIHFPNTRSAEDSCFLICSLLCAKRIISVDRALYHYRLQNSSTSLRRDPQRWRQRLESFRAMESFAREKGLWHPYRSTLRWLILKKGWMMAAKDYLKNNPGQRSTP